MTPAQFKTARKALGLSVPEMAVALRLKSERAVRNYENGSREISGPIQVALAYMLRYGPLEKSPK
jgi:transcriptional regulator with XRE-family HTH domain